MKATVPTVRALLDVADVPTPYSVARYDGTLIVDACLAAPGVDDRLAAIRAVLDAAGHRHEPLSATTLAVTDTRKG